MQGPQVRTEPIEATKHPHLHTKTSNINHQTQDIYMVLTHSEGPNPSKFVSFVLLSSSRSKAYITNLIIIGHTLMFFITSNCQLSWQKKQGTCRQFRYQSCYTKDILRQGNIPKYSKMYDPNYFTLDSVYNIYPLNPTIKALGGVHYREVKVRLRKRLEASR